MKIILRLINIFLIVLYLIDLYFLNEFIVIHHLISNIIPFLYISINNFFDYIYANKNVKSFYYKKNKLNIYLNILSFLLTIISIAFLYKNIDDFEIGFLTKLITLFNNLIFLFFIFLDIHKTFLWTTHKNNSV